MARARERVVLADRRGARMIRTRVEVQEQTEIGDALVRGLMRAQLGLALRLGVGVLMTCVSIPILCALFPAVGTWAIGGVRLLWIVLGPLLFGVLYVAGRYYVRVADQAEQDFLGIVDDERRAQ